MDPLAIMSCVVLVFLFAFLWCYCSRRRDDEIESASTALADADFVLSWFHCGAIESKEFVHSDEIDFETWSIVRNAFDAVVRVSVSHGKFSWQTPREGTGFLVCSSGKMYVYTNRHVITYRASQFPSCGDAFECCYTGKKVEALAQPSDVTITFQIEGRDIEIRVRDFAFLGTNDDFALLEICLNDATEDGKAVEKCSKFFNIGNNDDILKKFWCAFEKKKEASLCLIGYPNGVKSLSILKSSNVCLDGSILSYSSKASDVGSSGGVIVPLIAPMPPDKRITAPSNHEIAALDGRFLTVMDPIALHFRSERALSLQRIHGQIRSGNLGGDSAAQWFCCWRCGLSVLVTSMVDKSLIWCLLTFRRIVARFLSIVGVLALSALAWPRHTSDEGLLRSRWYGSVPSQVREVSRAMHHYRYFLTKGCKAVMPGGYKEFRDTEGQLGITRGEVAYEATVPRPNSDNRGVVRVVHVVSDNGVRKFWTTTHYGYPDGKGVGFTKLSFRQFK